MKLDQRGYNSAETRAKKAIGGKSGAGPSAFRARKSMRDSGLQARIDQVVADALAKEAEGKVPFTQDVVRHISSRLIMNGRARGARVG